MHGFAKKIRVDECQDQQRSLVTIPSDERVDVSLWTEWVREPHARHKHSLAMNARSILISPLERDLSLLGMAGNH